MLKFLKQANEVYFTLSSRLDQSLALEIPQDNPALSPSVLGMTRAIQPLVILIMISNALLVCLDAGIIR